MHKAKQWLSWDRKNYTCPKRIDGPRWDLYNWSQNLLLMGKEFWKASGTYTAKINPSNFPQAAKHEENEQHRQPQQYIFF